MVRDGRLIHPPGADEGLELGYVAGCEEAEAEEFGLLVDGPVLADDLVEGGECVGLVERGDGGFEGGGDQGGDAEAGTVGFERDGSGFEFGAGPAGDGGELARLDAERAVTGGGDEQGVKEIPLGDFRFTEKERIDGEYALARAGCRG